MSSYFIAIGGTGQMAALAYLRLAKLCGFAPADIYLMDCDDAGPVTQKLQKVLGKELIPTIRPIPEDEHVDTFRSIFEDPTNHKMNEALSVLFTDEQLQTHVKSGMYGKPPVGGTTLMEKIRKAGANSQNDQELHALINSIGKSSDDRIVVCGSVMGGTGAGGVPTLSHYIKHNIKGQAKLTIVDFLKWFQVPSNGTWDVTLETNAQSGIFYLKDKIARDVDACVLLGLDQQTKIDFRNVGEQEEVKHFINMLSAVISTNSFHASEYETLFKNANSIYAYAMPDSGFSSEEKDDLRVKLPNSREVTLTQIIKMGRAVSTYLGALAKYLEGGPSFWAFTPWAGLPPKLGNALKQLAKANAKNKKETWQDVYQAVMDKKAEVDEWLGWFDALHLPGYFVYPSDKTSISTKEYRDTTEDPENSIPMNFLRSWIDDMNLKNWEKNLKAENIDGFIKEAVLALRRTINKTYLDRIFGEDDEYMKWLTA